MRWKYQKAGKMPAPLHFQIYYLGEYILYISGTGMPPSQTT